LLEIKIVTLILILIIELINLLLDPKL